MQGGGPYVKKFIERWALVDPGVASEVHVGGSLAGVIDVWYCTSDLRCLEMRVGGV